MNRDAEIITFGCRLNIYESEILKQGIKKSNIKNTSVFNSCAVTSETVRQVKQSIRKRKRDNAYCISIISNERCFESILYYGSIN